jgi:4-hydroxy-4-methyl-2-oxoglutarate aldolase
MTTAESTSLTGLSTATLHETGARRILPIAIRPLDPNWRIEGRVFTVELAPGHNIWVHRALYAASPGDVLVVSTGGGYEFGYWGDVLTNAARAVGLAGLIIDGCIRDSAGLVEMGWPVFARGMCVRGTGKDAAVGGGLGGRIDLAGCAVETGDVVVGDRDGVVVLEATTIADVARRARDRDAKEAAIIARLQAGETTLGIYGLE